MSNVVFILGAGASRQCGAPLMSDFLDVASDLLRSNAVQEMRAEFEKVFSAIGALQSVHSKAQLDLNNIESIFTVLELGRIIQRVPGLSAADIVETITALKKLIVKTLEVTEFRGHLTKFLSVFDSAQELSQVPPELHQNFNLAIY